MPLTQNFDMTSGDSKTLKITVTNDETGEPLGLADTQIEWVLAPRAGGAPIVRKTVGDGIEITDATAGRCDVTLDAEDTDHLAGSYHHECEVEDTEGNASTIFVGTASISADSA